MGDDVEDLLRRSHRLGGDPRVTNFGGGNTSCKVTTADPVTGEPVEALYVKGSGGDLGTLTRPGHEDEMFGLLDHCRWGSEGAAPSIDTAMHAFVDAPHVDHLHPDAVIALATAADGESLTKECFGREVAWVPWRRPGFELGLQIGALQRDNPGLRGVVLGGHGLTTWAETAHDCHHTSLDVINRAERLTTRPTPVSPTKR